jgi:hypothetical protein
MAAHFGFRQPAAASEFRRGSSQIRDIPSGTSQGESAGELADSMSRHERAEGTDEQRMTTHSGVYDLCRS